MGRFIAILSSLSLCILLSCSHNEQDDVTNHPYLSNFSNSGCKKYISGATPATNSPSGKVATTTNDLQDEQIRLLTNDNKRLQIIHENTILSCDAVIETGFKVVGSTIILTEKSTMDTNCICHYDLSFTIDNLEKEADEEMVAGISATLTRKPFVSISYGLLKSHRMPPLMA